MPGQPAIELCTKADFDHILQDVADFWGSDRTLHLHHSMFLYEFGDSAYVIRDGANVVAYLFGFLSQSGPTAYVHLVGVRRSHQKRGYGRALYEHFMAFAQEQGRRELKAITSPGNEASIAFHRSLGMEVNVVPDYNGPGRDAVVFRRRI